jgi:hypothetical protein
MSVQLPPVDRKSSFKRHQAERYQSAPVVRSALWEGPRSRRWTLADRLVHTDVIPLAYGITLGLLIAEAVKGLA